MTDTTITISGIPIHEPMTVFTDFIIAALALTFYFQLKKSNDKTIINWGYFFLFLGIATFTGAFSHAFFAIHEGWQYKSIWLPMQIINGIGIYFAQRATFISVLQHSPYKKIWKTSYLIQLIAFIICLLLVQKYIVSIIENALALIPIMILHYKDKRPFAKRIANGIAISFITAFVHLAKLSLHDYFNYNNLAHVFIMISLFVMYKGVKLKLTEDPQR
ncbi:MAG TPA: hypothetical protein VLB84_08610 [Bacteroidia bacterium]|nr:hypothetical protein [Bacteroidia bacterium]